MKCQGNRLSRRNLLTVGAIGGLGLTLGDFFQLRAARGELKKYDFLDAKAQSVIHIYLPGGMAHQESFDPKPFAPIEYRGEMGTVKTNTGEVFCETLPKLAERRRQDRRHPLDDARRSGPRARHAQHVHGLSAQPGAAVSQHGQRRQPRIWPAEQSAAVRLHSAACPTSSPRSGYLSSSFAPFSLGADPADAAISRCKT